MAINANLLLCYQNTHILTIIVASYTVLHIPFWFMIFGADLFFKRLVKQITL